MKVPAMLLLPLALLLFLAGCSEKGAQQPKGPETDKKEAEKGGPEKKPPSDKEAKIKAALAKLPPEDRALALAQKFCPVMEKSRLGSMGTPIKVVIEGQPVFLCCKGCRSEATDEPAQTLAKVKELKQKAKGPASK